MAIRGVRPMVLACAGMAALLLTTSTAFAGGPVTPAAQGGVAADGSGMYGAWAPSADSTSHDAITWYLQSPSAPRGGLYGVIFYSNEASGEEFDCAGLSVQEGTLDGSRAFHARATVTHRARLACGRGAIAVRVPPVPEGLIARVAIPTSVTAAQNSYDALGVIAMSGRGDIHVRAPSLAVPSPSPSPSSTPLSSSAAPSTSTTPPSVTSSSSPAVTSTSPVAGVPTGVPLEARGARATAHLGVAGSTVLAVGVALGVLVVAAGLALLRRRST